MGEVVRAHAALGSHWRLNARVGDSEGVGVATFEGHIPCKRVATYCGAGFGFESGKVLVVCRFKHQG